MRFKLVLLTSLVASLFGVGFSIALILATLGASELFTTAPLSPPVRWLYLALSLPSFFVAVLGGIFAYRHTAHRRKLQAFLTGVLVLLFCLAEFIALERFLTFVD